MCLRRLLLMVMMRGALSDAMFLECAAVLLDAFGAHHIHTLSALEAAGAPRARARASPVVQAVQLDYCIPVELFYLTPNK